MRSKHSYMDSSRMSSKVVRTGIPWIGCGRISGLSVEDLILLAKMDIRSPRGQSDFRLQEPGVLTA